MILDETYNIKVSKKNIKWLESKGYSCVLKDVISIKTEDLPEGSHKKIKVKCDICGSEKELIFQKYIKNIKNGGYYACSSKCAQKKVRTTSNEKYGTDYYVQTDEYSKRVKETSIEKYNVEHFTQSDIVKKKQEDTNLSKYGKKSYLHSDDYNIKIKEFLGDFENVFQMEDVKEKSKQTNLKKYGTEYYIQSDKGKEIIKKKLLDKYNVDNVFKIKEIKEKIKKTLIENYGVENVFENNEIKEKIKKTLIEKYDVDNPMKNEFIKNKAKKKYKETIILKKKHNNPNFISSDDNNFLMICDKCNTEYTISHGLFYNRTKFNVEPCLICNPINSNISDKETKLYEFIKANYNDEIITSDRKILNGKELDIYLPDLNLAFEFNGLYWHNELNKENDYHLNKTNECEKQNIQLIHIWEDDWVYKQEIVKSMILNKLNKSKNKIYARKTIIKEISDNKLIKKFLTENHLQGFVGSKVKLGLFYKNELVSLMTFGKKRLITKSNSLENEYEMLRFCNKLNTNVVGSASKLFNYFTKNYNISSIISYADCSHSQGNLYETLGFKFMKKTTSNYYYIVDGLRKYRFNFRKDVLIKQGFDKNKTEHEIMFERKIYRIYDSGSLKYIFKN